MGFFTLPLFTLTLFLDMLSTIPSDKSTSPRQISPRAKRSAVMAVDDRTGREGGCRTDMALVASYPYAADRLREVATFYAMYTPRPW